MRAVEEKVGIAETAKDDFRREILEAIGAMAGQDRKFDPLDSESLREALEKKLFAYTKDQIQMARFVSVVQDEGNSNGSICLRDASYPNLNTMMIAQQRCSVMQQAFLQSSVLTEIEKGMIWRSFR